MQYEVIQRNALFAISLVLMAIGLFFNTGTQANEFFRAICLKTGIVLFMLWLALPQLKKLNYWAIVPTIVVAVLAIVRPQLIVIAARAALFLSPVLFLIWMMRSPSKSKPKPKR